MHMHIYINANMDGIMNYFHTGLHTGCLQIKRSQVVAYNAGISMHTRAIVQSTYVSENYCIQNVCIAIQIKSISITACKY